MKKILLTMLLAYSIACPCAKAGVNASSKLPTVADIATDLLGRRIGEGRENGYFGPGWIWIIERGEIERVTVIENNVSADYCSFLTEVILKENYRWARYKATVKVDYERTKRGWQVAMVQSKGVDIVRTGRYNDCITHRIWYNYWGFNNFIIKNNTDVPLIVGGAVMMQFPCTWRRFSIVVYGNMPVNVGYTLCCGNIVDYRIDFVERY